MRKAKALLDEPSLLGLLGFNVSFPIRFDNLVNGWRFVFYLRWALLVLIAASLVMVSVSTMPVKVCRIIRENGPVSLKSSNSARYFTHSVESYGYKWLIISVLLYLIVANIEVEKRNQVMVYTRDREVSNAVVEKSPFFSFLPKAFEFIVWVLAGVLALYICLLIGFAVFPKATEKAVFNIVGINVFCATTLSSFIMPLCIGAPMVCLLWIVTETRLRLIGIR